MEADKELSTLIKKVYKVFDGYGGRIKVPFNALKSDVINTIKEHEELNQDKDK